MPISILVESISRNQVDDSSRNQNQLPNTPAFKSRQNFFVRQDQFFDHRLIRIDRHGDFSFHFARNLNRQFYRLVFQQSLVVGWPSGLNDASWCTTALSQFFRDVRCKGSKQTGELIGLAGGQGRLVA